MDFAFIGLQSRPVWEWHGSCLVQRSIYRLRFSNGMAKYLCLFYSVTTLTKATRETTSRAQVLKQYNSPIFSFCSPQLQGSIKWGMFSPRWSHFCTHISDPWFLKCGKFLSLIPQNCYSLVPVPSKNCWSRSHGFWSLIPHTLLQAWQLRFIGKHPRKSIVNILGFHLLICILNWPDGLGWSSRTVINKHFSRLTLLH